MSVSAAICILFKVGIIWSLQLYKKLRIYGTLGHIWLCRGRPIPEAGMGEKLSSKESEICAYPYLESLRSCVHLWIIYFPFTTEFLGVCFLDYPPVLKVVTVLGLLVTWFFMGNVWSGAVSPQEAEIKVAKVMDTFLEDKFCCWSIRIKWEASEQWVNDPKLVRGI